MFYEPKNGHGLPHNPFNALITPRPIGWISTRGSNGSENLAPYSFFNGVAYSPPQVMFASTASKEDRDRGKDSIGNVIDTSVFCINVAGVELKDKMNITALPATRDVDEFDLAELDRVECETIACSRVLAAPASMECKLVKTVDLPGDSNIVAFGEVTGIHINDAFMVDGKFDVTKFQPLARMGYQDYTSVSEVFSLVRPKL